ncbi:MAG: serine/threonine protein phosphatase, partial [Lysobacterales bacterium CG_4_9_14_3_um_filter_62_6]
MPAGLSASAALTAIAELAQDLACSANLDASLSAVVQKIADTMRAEAASLFLLSADGTALVCRFSVGPVQFVGQRVVPGQGVIGRAMQTGVCQLVADASADRDFDNSIDAKSGFQTRSLLCTPLASAHGA